MPTLNITSVSFDLRRDVAIIDTNVLYAAFNSGDGRHKESHGYLFIENQYIIPIAVLVETWGLLVGRDKNWAAGFELLEWINDPANAVVIIHESESVGKIHEMALALHMDCVDVIVLYLADKISRECGFSPGCKIATNDRRDFFRSIEHHPFSFTLLDVVTLEQTPLN